MVYLSGVNGQKLGANYNIGFAQGDNRVQNSNIPIGSQEDNFETEQKEEAKLLYKEKKDHPILTTIKIEAEKLKNAFYTYPSKGFQGSKNSDFYEFLNMGTVPYLVGSAMMMAVFNLANRFYDPSSASHANKIGKKMALGVAAYGIFKNLSKNFVEQPLNLKYGIDVNLPYKKKIVELPEKRNTKDLVVNNNVGQNSAPALQKNQKNPLVAYQYHEAFESVDFPRWDLFYDNKNFGEKRNAYFDEVGKKMGFTDEELEFSDQKVKPLIKEKVVQTKFFSSLSSFLFAATGVCLAAQKPFEDLLLDPVQRFKDWKNGMKNDFILKDIGKRLVASYKELVGSDKASSFEIIKSKLKNIEVEASKKPLTKHIAGRLLIGSAIGTTLLGNFFTLTDFNKDRGRNQNQSNSLINDAKEKVVC